jgi:dihydrofolate reductase
MTKAARETSSKGSVMRKLVVNTFLTLDGVMQAPGGPEEDPTGGFTLGGWSMNHWDEAMGEVMNRSTGKQFDLLLGRKTYEIFAAYWPHSTEDGADQLNQAHKYVATTTLKSADWDETTILDGDVVAQIAELKEQDGPPSDDLSDRHRQGQAAVRRRDGAVDLHRQ